ncbi:hypothetical protein BDW72DRAFT_211011 [Aspergillus terricola var. indicus]
MSDTTSLPSSLPRSSAFYIVSPIFLSVASYNVLELLLWIFNTFERRRGLYFASILTSTLSLAAFIIAQSLRTFRTDFSELLAAGYIFAFSYTTLLTAHILVLYSRLHLVLHSDRVLRGILIMIIVTSVVSVPAQLTVTLALVSTRHPRLVRAEYILERVVFLGATVREFVVCAIYTVQAYRNLRPIAQAKGRAGKRVLLYLMAVQVAAIVLDMGFLVQIYMDLAIAANGYCALLYSIKLKMEFGVLNSLVTLLRSPLVLGSRSDGEAGVIPGLGDSGGTNRS